MMAAMPVTRTNNVSIRLIPASRSWIWMIESKTKAIKLTKSVWRKSEIIITALGHYCELFLCGQMYATRNRTAPRKDYTGRGEYRHVQQNTGELPQMVQNLRRSCLYRASGTGVDGCLMPPSSLACRLFPACM